MTTDESRILLAAHIAMCFQDEKRKKAIGAIVVKDNRLISCGHRFTEHDVDGYSDKTTHAEDMAIKAAGKAAFGATLYVTLEPCTFRATHPTWHPMPPCCEVIVAAGIARVVIGSVDSDIGHGGLDYLRAHGVEVVQLTGLEEQLAGLVDGGTPEGFSDHYGALRKARGL